MAFAQQLECDQMEEPSILWRLPLLLLSSVLKQNEHQLLMADDLLGEFAHRHWNNSDDESKDHFKSKWEPCLETIQEEEEEDVHLHKPDDWIEPTEQTCLWNGAWKSTLWNAGAYLPKQKRVLLGIFVSCCSPFVPMSLW